MNTQKQIIAMVALMFLLVGGCAAYTAIDLPVRSESKTEYHKSESVERGALLFANNCRTCHGDKGQGGIGLPLNIDEYKQQEPLVLAANQAKIRRTLYCGRVGTFMQPWLAANGGALNAIQIEHLVNLITAPIENEVVDDDGNPTSTGWKEAVEFSHNLNHEGAAAIGGDTLATISKTYGIGVTELVALNPKYKAGDVLPKGATIKLPKANGKARPDYKVLQKSETLVKIADNKHVGEALLAELNGIRYKIDEKKASFSLLNEQGRVLSWGLLPGTKLKFPDGGTYTAVTGDTLQLIADRLGVSRSALEQANSGTRLPSGTAEIKAEDNLVLKLPKVESFPVKGDDLEAVAEGLENVTAESLAEANKIPANAILEVGRSLKIPESAWGSKAAGVPNDGKACVEHAVPKSAFETLTGLAKEPDKPAAVSKVVAIVANANDWVLTADGTKQDANKGAATVAKGTAVEFTNAVGLHTITLNGKKDGADFKAGDKRTVTFNDTGKFFITCDYHPDMKAWLWVE